MDRVGLLVQAFDGQGHGVLVQNDGVAGDKFSIQSDDRRIRIAAFGYDFDLVFPVVQPTTATIPAPAIAYDGIINTFTERHIQIALGFQPDGVERQILGDNCSLEIEVPILFHIGGPTVEYLGTVQRNVRNFHVSAIGDRLFRY